MLNLHKPILPFEPKVPILEQMNILKILQSSDGIKIGEFSVTDSIETIRNILQKTSYTFRHINHIVFSVNEDDEIEGSFRYYPEKILDNFFIKYVLEMIQSENYKNTIVYKRTPYVIKLVSPNTLYKTNVYIASLGFLLNNKLISRSTYLHIIKQNSIYDFNIEN